MNWTITASKNPKPGPSKTGTLKGITIQEITKILGMTPNVEDDLEKVVNSWSFNALPRILNARNASPAEIELVFKHAFNEKREFKPGWYRCAIWDYKGSHRLGRFSTHGEPDVFKFLFGNRYEELSYE